jgi:hypothetical protein
VTVKCHKELSIITQKEAEKQQAAKYDGLIS